MAAQQASGADSDATSQVTARAVKALNSLDGQPVDATDVATPAQVRDAVVSGKSRAGLVIDPAGDSDILYVASGGGSAVVTAVEAIASQFADAQGRSYATEDLVPLTDGDTKGLTGFYLAVGWVVGGYLVASLLAIAEGARATSRRHAVVRLGLLAPYAVALGLGGAIITGPALGAWDGHVASLGLVGSLTVFAVAAATVGMQAVLGTFGIGAAVLLFVVLGNPSAGGPYPASLLPSFTFHSASSVAPGPKPQAATPRTAPTGAATQLVRETVYFGAGGIGWQLWVLAAYVVAGVALAVTVTHTLGSDRGRDEQDEPDLHKAKSAGAHTAAAATPAHREA